MVSDQQVRKLMKLISSGEPLARAAVKADMDLKTARKYRRSAQLPSQAARPHSWRTRSDPFHDVWDELRPLLEVNPGLLATTLFDHLQRRYPGRFQDGQLRTLQRKLKSWRALDGPPKEVFFPQSHHPGRLAASDFCHLSSLGVTLTGVPFDHLLYHFVLPYSNWETGSLCFSESFESLAAGLQAALFELGGVPTSHRTDSLTAAVQLLDGRDGFTRRYQELLAHYRLQGEHTNPGRANENGDVEQRHYRFRTALDQALMLRGSRDFESRDAYVAFLRELFAQLNAGRRDRLKEEAAVLRPLPAQALCVTRTLVARVAPSSTIQVSRNTYSVPSRLIGEHVEVKVEVEQLEVWYGQRRVLTMPRLRGKNRHTIDYRHVIDWLVRKPGAFANYRYRADLFPSSHFRMAYDALVLHEPKTGERQYLTLLLWAARQGELRVEAAVRTLLAGEGTLTLAAVERLLSTEEEGPAQTEVAVAPVDLAAYDALLMAEVAA